MVLLNKQKATLLALLLILSITLSAQQYTGFSGLIHTPTADMDSAVSVRLGGHFLNKEFTPDKFRLDGEKYNTGSFYMSITPFKWIELGYTITLMKFHKDLKAGNKTGYYSKDRYFSLKVQPIQEHKWWPSVALGSNDFWGQRDGESGSFYFRNFYLALSKHYEVFDQTIGVHLAYRHWAKDFNKKWNGPVGGLTFQPSFAKELRLIGEYDGDGVNVGADYLLFKHFLIQAAMQRGRYFSGGMCLTLNLL